MVHVMIPHQLKLKNNSKISYQRLCENVVTNLITVLNNDGCARMDISKT